VNGIKFYIGDMPNSSKTKASEHFEGAIKIQPVA